jgi:phage terminase large subunit
LSIVATSTIAYEVDQRRSGSMRRPLSPALSLLRRIREEELEDDRRKGNSRAVWPSTEFQSDPVRFGEEILGLRLWSRQIEIANAVRDHLRVAVKSGNKAGKTELLAMLCLWYYASFPQARVLITAVKAAQVDGVLWKAIVRLHRQSGICADCREENFERRANREPTIERPCPHSGVLDGRMLTLARSGLKADDGREIVGFTARSMEAVAGISGAHLFYVVDEASGVEQHIFEAIEGNRMGGGARMVLISNPTRTEGEFFDAFGTKAKKNNEGAAGYWTATINTEENPNFVEQRTVIPGLAAYEEIMDKRREWGAESALYRVRVLGDFVLNEDGKIIPISDLSKAVERWKDAEDDGRLRIGIDPSGLSGTGDEGTMAAVRGHKCLSDTAFLGLNEEGYLVNLLGLIKTHRRRGDLPALVAVDREGPIGYKVWSVLRTYALDHEDEFVVVGVRSSDKAQRQPLIFDRLRDELWMNAGTWIREGGSIPDDPKLLADLHSAAWSQSITGRMKATPKEDLRKALGRSPDRGDALALAVWPREDLASDDRGGPPDRGTQTYDVYEAHDEESRGMNAYDALTFGGRRREDD